MILLTINLKEEYPYYKIYFLLEIASIHKFEKIRSIQRDQACQKYNLFYKK